MKVQDTIRTMREMNQLTQEELAEKLNISVNAYSKIERGITKLSLDKLERIAQIFNINVSELYSAKEKGLFYLFSDNNNYYNGSEVVVEENEKLKVELKYKNEIIDNLRSENLLLKQMVEMLKEKS
ncbi:helix-turn-helix domain-containing protein [Rodentibacter haemolyticus]|uniref:Helix-turn-helix transcriptional regulator n=1 Tax=Rodentibacter haemolyticus TaxID=2778911 RepID=A0ABX6UY40_9PAST|nr:helix-turn-helix transcriptional regulator [Rodentibacter haemolyticus]QPB42016.1 helix-turn-helix transcriptional regulator [Rodentibacter haemolyticus]